MNRKITFASLAAVLSAFTISGCGSGINLNAGPITGQAGAPYVRVEGLNPPGFSPLVGFDISFVDSNGNYFLSSTGYTTGVLEINTAQMTSFTEPTVLGAGKTSFVGSLNPGYVTLDTAHPYEGGPSGVVAFNNPNAPTLVPDVYGAEEVWASDGANFQDQATISTSGGVQTAYMAGYTPTGPWMCDSAVQIYNMNNGEWHKTYTNGCFQNDEIAVDSADHLVIVTNPEEDPNLIINPNSTATPNFSVLCAITTPVNSPTCPASGVPTAPFVNLISTVPNAKPDLLGGYYPVVKQIAFDGTNGTPDARWSPIFFMVNGFPGNSGGIEQPLYSAAMGKIYIAVPNDATQANPANGAIAVITITNSNPATFAYTVTKFNLTNCSPNGMALGPDGKEVFLACNGFEPDGVTPDVPQIVSLEDGSTIASFPQSVPAPTDSASLAIYTNAGTQCDEAAYNPTTNVYVAACQFSYSNANVTVINAGSGLTGAKFQQNIATNPTAVTATGAAHSVSTDPVTGAVIVPLPMGDSLCPSYTNASNVGVGCLGIWAPQGSWLQKGGY
jgi:hypothetical protein